MTSLTSSMTEIEVNNATVAVNCVVESGSTYSFIHPDQVRNLGLTVERTQLSDSMATTSIEQL